MKKKVILGSVGDNSVTYRAIVNLVEVDIVMGLCDALNQNYCNFCGMLSSVMPTCAERKCSWVACLLLLPMRLQDNMIMKYITFR